MTQTTTVANTMLLVRHAHTADVGVRLSGRGGASLSDDGVAQAVRLARALAHIPLTAVYSSPLERAMTTAAALARVHGVAPIPCEALTDVDFGDWTGRTFVELQTDSAWRQFNRARASAVIPGGEQPLDVQRRIVRLVSALACRHPGETIALVTHAEVVRSAVLWVAGESLDAHDRYPIDPASVTVLSIAPENRCLLGINHQPSALEGIRELTEPLRKTLR